MAEEAGQDFQKEVSEEVGGGRETGYRALCKAGIHLCICTRKSGPMREEGVWGETDR